MKNMLASEQTIIRFAHDCDLGSVLANRIEQHLLNTCDVGPEDVTDARAYQMACARFKLQELCRMFGLPTEME